MDMTYAPYGRVGISHPNDKIHVETNNAIRCENCGMVTDAMASRKQAWVLAIAHNRAHYQIGA